MMTRYQELHSYQYYTTAAAEWIKGACLVDKIRKELYFMPLAVPSDTAAKGITTTL